jgi:NDP-mannose synthase
MKKQQAVILAGGKGTRLYPYTKVFPKALVPLGDMPVLELILRQLAHYGFEEAVLAVGHLSEIIQAYFGNGQKLGIRIRYAFEDQPLGTIGPLLQIEDLADDVLVMNGDIVSDINYKALLEAHLQQQATLTMALHRMTTQVEFGVIHLEPETQRVESFTEKPTYTHQVSMGIHVINRSALRVISPNQLYGLDHLMRDLLATDWAHLQGYPFEGYWLDIGRHSDYQNALSEFDLMKNRFLPEETPAALQPLSGDFVTGEKALRVLSSRSKTAETTRSKITTRATLSSSKIPEA